MKAMRALSSGKAAAPKQPQRRCFIFKIDKGRDEDREFCILTITFLLLMLAWSRKQKDL